MSAADRCVSTTVWIASGSTLEFFPCCVGCQSGMPGEKRPPLFTLEQAVKLCERSLIWADESDIEVSC